MLPMWVADMDFKTSPDIIQAIDEKVKKGIFGYTTIPDEWYLAYQEWWQTQHDYHLEKEWLMFCTGVVPAISSVVRKLTTPAEKVLILTPVYNVFFNSILNSGRIVLESPLIYKEQAYNIDYLDLEEKLSDSQTTLMILCNPHNPIGKVWSRAELQKIGDLCERYGVLVVADEIHCDLVLEGSAYIPFASVSKTCEQISITCIAPTKAFNIAGMQTAAISVPNERLRTRVNRTINTDEVAEPNALAMEATIAAWTKGQPWLEALKIYLLQNRQLSQAFILEKLPQLKLVNATATYLLWIDCKEVTTDTVKLCEYLQHEVGLYVSSGDTYGAVGKGFIRINIACPKDRLEDGLGRLQKGIEQYRNKPKVGDTMIGE